MKTYSILLLMFYLLCVVACQTKSPKHNIKAYYFPIETLSEGKVYEYQPVNNDTLPTEYWYYKTYESDTGTFFTGNFYDEQFYVRQFFTEEIVGNGTLMYNYFLYAFDSTGNQVRVPAEILVPNVYPFEVQDSGGIFLFKLKWDSGGQGNGSTTLIRNRRYVGKTTYPYKDIPQECVEFELRELIDLYDEKEGHAEPELEGKELYAKGLGLIYYKKKLSDDSILEYELTDIYGMKQLETKFKLQMEQ